MRPDQGREENPLYKVHHPDKCIGETCGCERFCTRVFKCPGLIWDRNTKKAKIDEAVCSGCGVCVEICSQDAISGRQTDESGWKDLSISSSQE
jgi:indolepyruvate ferredoxin oxidoreductase alpha subunit